MKNIKSVILTLFVSIVLASCTEVRQIDVNVDDNKQGSLFLVFPVECGEELDQLNADSTTKFILIKELLTDDDEVKLKFKSGKYKSYVSGEKRFPIVKSKSGEQIFGLMFNVVESSDPLQVLTDANPDGVVEYIREECDY